MDNLPTSQIYLMTNILMQARIREWPRGRTISYMITHMSKDPSARPSAVWAEATNLYDSIQPHLDKMDAEKHTVTTAQQLDDMIRAGQVVDVLDY